MQITRLSNYAYHKAAFLPARLRAMQITRLSNYAEKLFGDYANDEYPVNKMQLPCPPDSTS
jgi:hypothetical protein